MAILRGVNPNEVALIGETLYHHDFRCIEVPLNSPSPFESIEILSKALPRDCLVGAGTVVNEEDVAKVKDAGGKLIVSPNTCEAVIRESLSANMYVIPGIATPSDAIRAVKLGATYLKLFPASTYGTGHVRALMAVLPNDCQILAVGGVSIDSLGEWMSAGVVGFGVGSELYRVGDSAEDVGRKAAALRELL